MLKKDTKRKSSNNYLRARSLGAYSYNKIQKGKSVPYLSHQFIPSLQAWTYAVK